VCSGTKGSCWWLFAWMTHTTLELKAVFSASLTLFQSFTLSLQSITALHMFATANEKFCFRNNTSLTGFKKAKARGETVLRLKTNCIAPSCHHFECVCVSRTHTHAFRRAPYSLLFLTGHCNGAAVVVVAVTRPRITVAGVGVVVAAA